nr:hypothetical protein [Tanacetum cinerariifolium]
MHNNIMAAGSRNRPLMHVTGRYPQWRSRFLRYINTRPNGETLRKCILSGPYKPTTILVQAVDTTDDSLPIPEHTTVETPMNMTPENKAHFEAEKEAIHLILTGLGDEIYSTVDACQTAQEIWEAIERFQQGESLNIQDVKTNLFLEFGKFTSHDGDTIESYYTRFYKLMNEMIQNNLTVATIKLKRVKDSVYHKEKMMMCKQAEQCVSLQEKQYDWLANMDEEVYEEELKAHYSYMAKIQVVPTVDSGIDSEPLEQIQNEAGYNVFANDLQYFEQSKSVSNTCLVVTDDSNVIPDSPDMCEDDIQNDQNDVESDDEHVALANLIANLKLDVDENKKIQNKSLGESISVWDSCLVTLQTKQTEFEKYKAFNDRTTDYDKLERKLNETLGQLAQRDIEIKEGLVKQKTKVITDLKLREEQDIDKMLSMEKQLKFLNEIVYKRSQSIQTIHMMAPKVPTYNGRPTFSNPRYLKQAQSEIPCLYAFPYDQSTHENRLIPDEE